MGVFLYLSLPFLLLVYLFIELRQALSLLTQNPFIPSLTSWPLNRQNLLPYFTKVADVLATTGLYTTNQEELSSGWKTSFSPTEPHYLQPYTVPLSVQISIFKKRSVLNLFQFYFTGYEKYYMDQQ